MITASLRLGGLVAAADDKQLASLTEYGRFVGLAFQIVDDLLDYNGTEERMGKRIGKDHVRGKLTFPGVLGENESRRRAEELVERACAAVAPLGPIAGGLEDLARYILQRDH
jgi:geranylgeranyl diphosphate synthase type II